MISSFDVQTSKSVNVAKSVLVIMLGVSSLFGFQRMALYPAYKDYLSGVNSSLIEQYVFEGECENPVVAVTFDDGPIANTQKIRQLLQKREIPATFFVIGQNMNESYAQLYQDPLFELGLHSYYHKDYRTMEEEEIEQDFEKNMKMLVKYSLSAKYFRPPYGIVCPKATEMINRYGLQGVLWSLDSHDWAGYSGEELVSQIHDNLAAGSIILLHDSIEVYELSLVLDVITQSGYDFIPLSELLECQ
jgi:peptidoglycan/xylan/chitin deacetylase (PgdA/CDA1 family)